MPGSFIDTNVLVYVASGDPVKAERAEKIIADGGTISVQVLNCKSWHLMCRTVSDLNATGGLRQLLSGRSAALKPGACGAPLRGSGA